MQANIKNGLRAKDGRSAHRSERGSSIVEAALVSIFILIPLLLGTIDFGRVFYVSIEVANAASAGAKYGTQHVPSTADMANVVTVTENEAPDIATTCGAGKNACWVSGYPLAQWGCECSNVATTGTTGVTLNSTTACSACAHPVEVVIVTTKATYTPMFNFRGWFSPITLNSQAKVRFASQ